MRIITSTFGSLRVVSVVAVVAWLLGVGRQGFGQVGIGTATPSPQSILELSATDKGFLPPRLDRTVLSLGPSHEGMIVYDTNDNGLYYWDGAAWQALATTSGASPWDKSGSNVYLVSGSDNVGIGTAAPASLLSVGGNNEFRVNTTGDLIRIKDVPYAWPNANSAGVLNNDGSGNLTWSAPPVLIGGNDIDIVGNQIDIEPVLQHVHRIDAPNTSDLQLVSNGVRSIRLMTLGGTDRMTILDNGQVGIGTAAPASLLSVGGNNEFRVNTTGDLIRIKDVPYAWPATQGAAGTFLRNDGSGNLSWTVPSVIGGSGTNDFLPRWTPDGTTLGNSLIQDNGTRLSVGVAPSNANQLIVRSTNSTSSAIRGEHTEATAGDRYGVYGTTISTSTSGAGVFGSTNTVASGVLGENNSAAVNATGIRGRALAMTANQTFGISGTTLSSNLNAAGVFGTTTSAGAGVRGWNEASIAGAAGVYGHSAPTTASTLTYGVQGVTTSTHIDAAGVYGFTNSAMFAVNGRNESALAGAAGVRGAAISTTGVKYGVHGSTVSTHPDAAGVYGTTLNDGSALYGLVTGSGTALRARNIGTGNVATFQSLSSTTVINNSGQVGIGTAAPASLLSVGGGNEFRVDNAGNLVRVRNVPYSWPNANSAGVLTNDGSGNLSWAATSGDNLGNHLMTQNLITDGYWISGDNDPEGLFVNFTGNVGVNQSTIADIFHVNDRANAQGSIRLTAGTLTGTSTTDGLAISVNGSAANILNYENRPLHLGTNGMNRVSIDAAGNVGIGTTTPGNLLHATGTDAIATIRGVNASTVNQAAGVRGITTGAGFTAGVLGETSASGDAVGVWGNHTGGQPLATGVFGRAGNASTNQTFGVWGQSVSTGPGSAGVYGVANGNGAVVGVYGFTNSTHTSSTGVYALSSGAGAGLTAQNDGTGPALRVAGSTYDSYFTGDGRLGIGSATPPELLSVGNSNEFRVDENGNLVRVRDVPYSWPNAQGGAGTVLTNDGSGNLSWSTGAGNFIQNQTSVVQTADFRISGSPEIYGGQLGMFNPTSNWIRFIGNQAPPSFTVRSQGTRLILGPALSPSSTDYALGVATNEQWYSVTQAAAAFSHRFYGGTTPLMTIRGDGRVGIGTTAPTTNFHLSNASALTEMLVENIAVNSVARVLTSQGTTQLAMIIDGAAGVNAIGTQTNHGFSLITNNAQRLTLDNNGRIGVNAAPIATSRFYVTDNALANSIYTINGLATGTALRGEHTGTGVGTGVSGISGGTGGRGVFGSATGGGQVYGVLGTTASTTGGSAGVRGECTATTGSAVGVLGSTVSTSTNAAGVSGAAEATSGVVYGVLGTTASSTSGSSGVQGLANATTGITYGVYGISNSTNPSACGVFASSTNSSTALRATATDVGQAMIIRASGVKTTNYTGATVENVSTSLTASVQKVGLAVTSTGGWTGAGASNTGLLVSVAGGTNNYAALFTGGNVGIGCTTPAYPLHVTGEIRSTVTINTAGIACSDLRLKRDFAPITGALSLLTRLNGKTYFWRRDEFPEWQFTDKRQYGFVAQEMEEVLPDLVWTLKDSMATKTIDYEHLTPILVEGIKEQQAQIETKADKTELEALKAENLELRRRIDRLTQELADQQNRLQTAAQAQHQELNERLERLERLLSAQLSDNNN
jgi:hypothetical protein